MKNPVKSMCVAAFVTLALFPCALFACSGAYSQTVSVVQLKSLIGQIVDVTSADSLKLLLPDGQLIDVDLAGLKAPPESISERSRLWLSSQLHNQLVSADCQVIKGLHYCIIYPDHRDINFLSLYQGYSVCDEESTQFQNIALYRSADARARKEKAGLWSD